MRRDGRDCISFYLTGSTLDDVSEITKVTVGLLEVSRSVELLTSVRQVLNFLVDFCEIRTSKVEPPFKTSSFSLFVQALLCISLELGEVVNCALDRSVGFDRRRLPPLTFDLLQGESPGVLTETSDLPTVFFANFYLQDALKARGYDRSRSGIQIAYCLISFRSFLEIVNEAFDFMD